MQKKLTPPVVWNVFNDCKQKRDVMNLKQRASAACSHLVPSSASAVVWRFTWSYTSPGKTKVNPCTPEQFSPEYQIFIYIYIIYRIGIINLLQQLLKSVYFIMSISAILMLRVRLHINNSHSLYYQMGPYMIQLINLSIDCIGPSTCDRLSY